MTDDRTIERRRLVAALLGPAEPELTCEECFEYPDRYVDTALAGEDADRAVPGMRAHLIVDRARRRIDSPPKRHGRAPAQA